MNDHYDESELQEYHDGLPGKSENATIRVHLQECQQCAALDRRVIAFERAMRMIPLEQPDPACTTQILARIARPAHAEWLDHVLEPRIIAGATIGLFGMAGTVSAVLLSLPVPSGAETRSLWGIALDGIFREIVAGPDVLAGWATRIFPQVFNQGAVQVSLAVVLLLPLFLFADRMLGKRRVMG
jgi:hypothetical protein